MILSAAWLTGWLREEQNKPPQAWALDGATQSPSAEAVPLSKERARSLKFMASTFALQNRHDAGRERIDPDPAQLTQTSLLTDGDTADAARGNDFVDLRGNHGVSQVPVIGKRAEAVHLRHPIESISSISPELRRAHATPCRGRNPRRLLPTSESTGSPSKKLHLFRYPNGCYFRNESPSFEDRLILIAFSSKHRLLFVVHAEVGRDAVRIVSARRASPAQRKIYDALD